MFHLGKGTRTLAAAATGVLSLSLVAAAPGTSTAATTVAHHSSVVSRTADGIVKSRVVGTAEDGRRVTGTFTPSSFDVVNGTLMATGTLDAVLRGQGKARHASKTVTLPVKTVSSPGGSSLAAGGKGLAATAASGSCDILNLVLGPLDLDLLGLQVHLDKVVLNIVAQSGAGNLLGNLLCQVAGLLDGGGPLSGLLGTLSDLLNQILGQLQL